MTIVVMFLSKVMKIMIMDKSRIISEIEGRVSRESEERYSTWTIGVTNTPKIRKDQHDSNGKKVEHWKDWSTDSEKDGRDIEEYFLYKGMKGDTEGEGTVSYIYIF